MLDNLSPIPDWTPIHRAQPINIESPKPVKRKTGKHTTHVCLPDPQIGYRLYEDGTYDPFHDEKAMDIALQITSWLEENDRVDSGINLGDFLDLPAQGRLDQ